MAKRPIQIDLRRDLPKVREQYGALVEHIGVCFYSSPCAVGAMLSPGERVRLRQLDDSTRISILIDSGKIVVPDEEQRRDLIDLQNAFDGGDAERFEHTLARLEAEYLTEQAA